jgi:hypothetical protein
MRSRARACISTSGPTLTSALFDALTPNFAEDDLIVCDVADGRARIWSDVRLHADGFGRLLIVDNGLEGAEPAQLVQRLQELGNYRNMALLGLPLAQRLTPQLTALAAPKKSGSPKKSGNGATIVSGPSGAPVLRIDAHRRKEVTLTLLLAGGEPAPRRRPPCGNFSMRIGLAGTDPSRAGDALRARYRG